MASKGRSRGLIIILIAVVVFILVIGATVFVLGGNFISSILSGGGLAPAAQPAAEPTQSTAMVEIIIVQQPVVRGTTLTESVLAKIPYPQTAMVEGLFFTDIQSVLGKRAKFDLQQGTPLVPSLLSETTIGSNFAMQIPKGKVAITIPLDGIGLTSVAYALQPGDHVNVIGSLTLVDIDANFQTILPNHISVVAPPQTITSGGQGVATTINSITSKMDPAIQGRAELDTTLNQPVYVIPSEEQRSRIISQTVIQDAIVLGIGDLSADQPFKKAPSSGASEGGNIQATPTPAPPKPKMISLVVSPQDAETLNFLVLSGSHINLALRNAEDDQKPTTDAVTLRYIMDQYNIPYPAKLPYGLTIPVATAPAAGQAQ